ncbi:MAG: hypothetical protein ACI8S6_005893 [Myxococcota bacterium]
MSLSEDERRELVTGYLEELEAEHDRREAAAGERRKRNRSQEMEEQLRAEEADRIRNELRLRFYEKNNYQQSVDRTGRTVWLSPSELKAHSQKQRKKNKKKSKRYKLNPYRAIRLRDLGLFVLMCASAVVIGLMLAS